MDYEVINFMTDTIRAKKPKFKELSDQVSTHFNTELKASDLSFILQEYRGIVIKLWTEECIKNLKEKSKSGRIDDEKVIEMINHFKGLDAFENTPDILKGDFYKIIESERQLFTAKDFIAARISVTEYLAYMLKNLTHKVKNEFEFQENLITVMRNAYLSLNTFINALKLEDFINGKLSVYKLAQNILNKNFDIDGYQELKKVSITIENHPSVIRQIMLEEVKNYMAERYTEMYMVGEKRILNIKKKLMMSMDLNVEIGKNIDEIHIICDILHVDQNLPSIYRGKNIFVIANTISLHKASTWNVSGNDAPRKYFSDAGKFLNGDGRNGGDGEPGESGGNCEIFCKDIINVNLWTLKSNGGNGSDGQDGGDGSDGKNGHDIQVDDFKIIGQKITSTNFIQLLKQCGISTESGSRRMNFYENGCEKILVFNRSTSASELIVLIKGTFGTFGGLGGFGGYCGRGGYAGKVSVNCESDKNFHVEAMNGIDGQNGKNGLNGIDGRDGRDAYSIVTNDGNEPKYGGLNQISKLDTSITSNRVPFSIYYKPLNKYLYVSEYKRLLYQNNNERNTLEIHKLKLKRDESNFFDNLIAVLRNANEKMDELIRKLKIREFIDLRTDYKTFITEITKNSFDIRQYDVLRSLASIFTIRQTKIESKVRDVLKVFTSPALITNKVGNIYELKKKLLTTADLNAQNEDFHELQIICDTLHINSGLSNKFRSKTIMISAQTINIHRNIEWNISGRDNFLSIISQGHHEENFENGGICFIECNRINNASLLTIKSNGGNASNAEDGLDPQVIDFKINGMSVENLSESSMKRIFLDGKFVKQLVKYNNSNYLLIVKGTDGINGFNGLGQKGGIGGYVNVKILEDSTNNEINIEFNDGKDDSAHDGRDICMYKKSGIVRYIGLNERNRYDLLSSNQFSNSNISIPYSSKYYYPQLSRTVNGEIGSDDLAMAENIIWVLKNSHSYFETIINNLGIRDYVNGKIPLKEVASRIISERYENSLRDETIGSAKIFKIANYENLKKCAVKFSKPNPRTENFSKKRIQDFIGPAYINRSGDTITVKKKIYHSSNLSLVGITSNIKEIRLICGILYIDSDLPSVFRGRNLAILANTVRVIRNATWDLSGISIVHKVYLSDAGKDMYGNGKDGEDGKAGNSGGNFSLNCKTIENPSALTIISNGANGGDGQNGGNGENGQDGKDADEGSFYRNGVQWKTYLDPGNKNKMYSAFNFGDNYRSLDVTTDDGLKADVFVQVTGHEDWGMILVRGSNGKPGKSGGVAGYGGEGGFAGNISIQTEYDSSSNEVKIICIKGKDGKMGINGYNGTSGRDGRDLYKYDQRNWNSATTHGESYPVKYKLVWKDNTCSVNCVYDYAAKKYVYIEEERQIYHSSIKNRNNSKINRRRMHLASAKQNSSINIQAMKQEFQSSQEEIFSPEVKYIARDVSTRSFSILNEINVVFNSMANIRGRNEAVSKSPMQEISTTLSLYEQFMLREPTNKLQSKRKSDILGNSLLERYANFFKTSNDKVNAILNKYQETNTEIEAEKIHEQIQIKTQVQYETIKKELSRTHIEDQNEEDFFKDFLDILLNGSTANFAIEAIRKSDYSTESYKYITNLSCDLQKSQRKIQEDKNLFYKSIDRFIESDESNLIISNYRKLKLSNDKNWRKCYDDAEVIKAFIQLIQEKYPFFVNEFMSSFINGSQVELKDLVEICNEKILLRFYRAIYWKSNRKIHTPTNKHSTLSFSTTDFEALIDKIRFLDDTKELDFKSEQLHKHFEINGDYETREIFEYLQLNLQNYENNLPEAIFNLLINYTSDLIDIKDTLETYSKSCNEILSEELDDKKSFSNIVINEQDIAHSLQSTFKVLNGTGERKLEPTNLYYYDKKKEKFIELLRKFYKEAQIIRFIEKNLMIYGSNSPLYRRILSHKYDIKMVIFVRDIDMDTLKVVEKHNFAEDIKFDYRSSSQLVNEYLNKQHVSSGTNKENEMFLLLSNHRLTNLKFNNKKYETFLRFKEMELEYKEIVESLKENNTKEQNVSEYLEPIIKKFSIRNNKYLSVFDDNNYFMDSDTLISIIMSHFPRFLIKYDDNGTTEYEINEDIQSKVLKSINDENNVSKYEIQNDEELREFVRLDLSYIFILNGSSILKAILIKFSIDTNSQTLKEFSLILRFLLDFMSNGNSFSYLLTFILLSSEQDMWPFELAILKLQYSNEAFDSDKVKRWRSVAHKIKHKKILFHFYNKVLELDNTNEKLNENDLDQIMENLKYFNEDKNNFLINSNLLLWKSMTTKEYWKNELKKFKVIPAREVREEIIIALEDINTKFGDKAKQLLSIMQKKELDLSKPEIKSIMSNFKSNEWILNDKVLDILENIPSTDWSNKLSTFYQSDSPMRDALKIVEIIKSDDETSPNVKNAIEDIGSKVKEIPKLICPRKNKRYYDFDESEIKNWTRNFDRNTNYLHTLAVIMRVFSIKKGFFLRDTQITSILIMWQSQNGILMQVSTGEGKTFLGVSFAILKVLYGEKIDIITSSSVLAMRDAEENKDFYSYFNISVNHNCYEKTDDRKKCYDSQVVYGTLGNFQRDYLLTEFFDENFLSSHNFDNVLVDEVDSMLLDKGNNILYLSSDLPDIDEIESVFLFIWQYVSYNCNSENSVDLLDKEIVRRAVLDNINGTIFKEDLEMIKNNIDGDAVIDKLKTNNIIDNECMFCDKTFSDKKFDAALLQYDDDFRQKVKAFCKNKITKYKSIHIPNYLQKFVNIHLDKWIENAVRALILENEREYIVDQVKSGTTSWNPNVIILDLDTGTDMTNSQWDEGLHQFLQLKHGCKLSLISLKSVFISNVSYFKKYKKLYGMTGTLGNLEERKKTTEMHKIDYVTVPRFTERKFNEYTAILETDVNKWIQSIYDEIFDIFQKNRSVLIICETIQDTKIMKKKLLANPAFFTPKNVIIFQRDSKELNVGKLESRNVIIATNLAGRGTDIKLSKSLKESGGLHVIMSYLPQNTRIENQAMGRAARAGEKGSGRLIIYSESDKSIAKIKENRDLNEYKRLDEVTKYYKNFITIEEKFFARFHTAYRELKIIGNEAANKDFKPTIITDYFTNNYSGFNDVKGTNAVSIYLDNFKLQWSFWLDANSKHLDNWKEYNAKDKIEKYFLNFLSSSPKLHPVKRIELFKFFNNEAKMDLAEKSLYGDFNRDLCAYQYYKCYEMIKSSQTSNNHSRRDLTYSETRELIICLRMLKKRIHSRNVYCKIIETIKKGYQGSFLSIEAFENQQKVLNEIDEIFIESLHNILGTPITPDKLRTPDIQYQVMVKQLYDELISNDCINRPKVTNHYTKEDLQFIAESNNADLNDLMIFLQNHKYFTSLEDLGSEMKKAIKLPSREEFWDIIVKKGILKDVNEYVIIDLDAIGKVDPSIADEIQEKLRANIVNELAISKSNEILFSNPIDGDRKNTTLIIRKDIFKSKISDARYKYLERNGVISYNKRAIFDREMYNRLKNTRIFNKFDEVTNEDFSKISKNYHNIIENLTKKEHKILIKRKADSFSLNYENLELLDTNSEIDILKSDSVHRNSILKLLKIKFSYRLALEKLAKNVAENEESALLKNININLHISPHVNLLNSLIAEVIIEKSKSNISKINNISKIKSRLSLENIEFLKLSGSSQIFSNNKTLGFIKGNLNAIINDLSKIEEKLKDYLPHLLNEKISDPDIVLKPIEDSLKTPQQREYIEFLKLKGFDMIMKVEQKMYSLSYWIRFSIVMILAVLQIVAGIAIMILSKGIGYRIGSILINEGISDMIFALGSLKSGHFEWSDYGIHKAISITTSLIFGFLPFSSAPRINSSFVSKLGKGQSVFNLLKSNSAARKEAFKLFGKTLILKTGTAIVQSGIGYVADHIIEKFLSDITKGLSDMITDQLQSEFFKHNLSGTINKLHEYYTSKDVKEIIFNEFKRSSKIHQHIQDVIGRVSSRIDEMIRTNPDVNKLIAFGASILTKIIDIATVSAFCVFIFGALDSKAKEILSENVKNKRPKINIKLNMQEVENVKKEIFQHIKAECSNKFKGTIEASVVKPMITHSVTFISQKILSEIKNYSLKQKEKTYAKEANVLLTKYNQDDTLSKPDLDKVNRLLMKSTNPNLHAALTKLDVPLSIVSLEASTIVLQKNLGSSYKIVVDHNGIKHEFGNKTDPNGKIINLKLQNGHFENSKNSKFGNNCMYDALCDKAPELKNNMSAKEFRNAIAGTMLDNKAIISEIHSPTKDLYRKMGFYGGNPKRMRDDGNEDRQKKIPRINVGENYEGPIYNHGLASIINPGLNTKSPNQNVVNSSTNVPNVPFDFSRIKDATTNIGQSTQFAIHNVAKTRINEPFVIPENYNNPSEPYPAILDTNIQNFPNTNTNTVDYGYYVGGYAELMGKLEGIKNEIQKRVGLSEDELEKLRKYRNNELNLESKSEKEKEKLQKEIARILELESDEQNREKELKRYRYRKNIFEVHHEPPDTFYKNDEDTYRMDRNKDMPCIALPYAIHRELFSSKLAFDKNSEKYKEIEDFNVHMKHLVFDDTVKFGIIDIYNKALLVYRQDRNNPGYNNFDARWYKNQFPNFATEAGFMQNIKDFLKRYVNFLKETPIKFRPDFDINSVVFNENDPIIKTFDIKNTKILDDETTSEIIKLIDSFKLDEVYRGDDYYNKFLSIYEQSNSS